MNREGKDSGRRVKLSEALRRSFIIYYVTRFSIWIYTFIKTSAIGRLLVSYDRLTEAFESSYIVTKLRSLTRGRGTRFHITRTFGFARAYEKSFFLMFLHRVRHTILYMYVSTIGLFLFSFGFYISVIQLLKRFTFHVAGITQDALMAGLILMALSFLMFFSKKTLAGAVYESRILRFIIFDFLGLRTFQLPEYVDMPRSGVNVPFLLAMVLGLSTIFIDPLLIIAALILLTLVFMILASPESGVLLTFLFLPLMPTMVLLATVILTAFSYFVKLLCGRRTLRFTLVDYAVLLFMIFVLFGGVFTVSLSSIPKMLVFLCFMLGYFVVKNTVRSPSLVRRCFSALAVSGAYVSLYGLYQNFFGTPATTWQDTTVFSEIRGRVVSTFANPNVLGEFLIMIIPITLALMVTSAKKNIRFILLLAALADCACLVFTWSRGAWLGFALSIVLFLCFCNRDFFTAGILCLPLLLGGLFLGANTSVIRRFTSFGDSSTSYRLGIWQGVCLMLADIFYFGIGIGEGAFREIYPLYTMSGIEAAPHSHSLYLQLTVELGIAGLLAFLAFIFFFAQCSLTFAKTAKTKSNRILTLGVLFGMTAFLIQGLTDYVFYNYRLFLLFWMVAGLGIAHIFTAKETTEESDPIYY